VKRSLLVEAAGGPLGATIAGANVHDTKLLAATLAAIVVARPQPTAEEPQPLCLDKGYDNPTGHETVAAYQYIPHIRRIGEEKLDANGQKTSPARRWVVESSHLSYPYPDKRLLSYDWPVWIGESRRRRRKGPAPGRARERDQMPTDVLPPPPLGDGELFQVGMRLPAANRQRLLRRLSQRLAHQLRAAAAPGEASDASASRH